MRGIKYFVLGLSVGVIVVVSALGGAILDRRESLGVLDKVVKRDGGGGENGGLLESSREVVDEENVVTKVVEEATPGVVTVSLSRTRSVAPNDPFNIFEELFGVPRIPRNNQEQQNIEQDIGSGFIISGDGLIMTNKHVVSDTSAKYRVVIGKDEVVEVKEIYRDPTNDLAILKVAKTGLKPLKLGDSGKLKVGQTVIAIGTALGEFRSTVTKGVISGLGRGIEAGSPFQGAERLNDVIQTDAAINPGNSGGPLLNSSGEVIGVNVAVSAQGQNIGFALPINRAKEVIANFQSTGQFDRPFIGVSYQSISRQSALLNDVPQGAYVREVVNGGPADKAGIKNGDIIVEIEGNKLNDSDRQLADLVNRKKIGDEIKMKVWREGKEMEMRLRLEKRQ